MKLKPSILIFLVSCSLFLEIPKAFSGTYQSTCPADKLAKIEAEIRKNFKPKRNKDDPPDTVEKRIKKAFKKCRVTIQITG